MLPSVSAYFQCTFSVLVRGTACMGKISNLSDCVSESVCVLCTSTLNTGPTVSFSHWPTLSLYPSPPALHTDLRLPTDHLDVLTLSTPSPVFSACWDMAQATLHTWVGGGETDKKKNKTLAAMRLHCNQDKMQNCLLWSPVRSGCGGF